ncbi:hypothetical protein OS493_000347 [Desmophyllum pertusum]|uniref:Uncharacterized protein n=1 Tax=Desmophyllum pertusum TaxID=174260 RepID=A0A9X0A706_9CNID|nr:hypothetical protein OS493_000347 [Desmophyllum pertusum]
MAMAKWKKESTFRRHDLRDIAPEGTGQDTFQATVLQEGILLRKVWGPAQHKGSCHTEPELFSPQHQVCCVLK